MDSTGMERLKDEEMKGRLDGRCPKCGVHDFTLHYHDDGTWGSPYPNDDVWCDNCGATFPAKEVARSEDSQSPDDQPV